MDNFELINSHIHLAESLAKRKKKSVRKSVYYEELLSAALTGLVKAASRYNSDKGVFRHYAVKCINGEIDDYLRELSWSRHRTINMKSIDGIDIAAYDFVDKEKIVAKIMELLSERGQYMFKWYYQDGLTMKQIGERLKISESMVSFKMKRYKKLLRKDILEIIT